MKIAICVPYHGDVKAEFADSLVRLTIATLDATRHQINPFFLRNSILPAGRIQLAEAALEWGADRMLWADSDHRFPGNALLRLLAHDVDAAGANYVRVSPPHEFTATGLDGKPLESGSGLEPVLAMGLGLCLVKASVFNQLPRPWFQTTVLENGEVDGEDFHFFRLLRHAGFKAFVDGDLSAEVGHVGRRVYMAHNVGRVAP